MSGVRTPHLLRNTQPLVVDPELATVVGLTEAIIMQQIHYWCVKNEGDKYHYKEGNTWVYNSMEQWVENFPFWSRDTIRRALSRLQKDGLVITGSFNKDRRDRTLWYRVDYDVMKQRVEVVLNANRQKAQMQIGKKHTPLPETTTETNLVKNCGGLEPSDKKGEDMLKDSYKTPARKLKETTKPVAGSSETLARNFETAEEALADVDELRMVRKVRRDKKLDGKIPSPSVLGRMWMGACNEAFEDIPIPAIIKAEQFALHLYAQRFCRQGKYDSTGSTIPFENFSKFMMWSIAHWSDVRLAKLHWMTTPAKTPEIRMFVKGMIANTFYECFVQREHIEQHRGLTQRESHKLTLKQAGHSEQEAERRTAKRYGSEDGAGSLVNLIESLKRAAWALQDTKLSQEQRDKRIAVAQAAAEKVKQYREEYKDVELEDVLNDAEKWSKVEFK